MKRKTSLLALAPALAFASCSEPQGQPEEGIETSENAESEMVEEIAEVPSIDAGIAVGATVPLDANFKTADGEKTLATILEDGAAILVFTRSVEWCPFCQTQLKGINAIVGDLQERGYKLYGVSYDSVDSQGRFSKNQMLDYKMLSDESSTAIDAFGLRDPQYTEGKALGVPYASVVVIDKDGKVTAKSVSGDFKKRPTNDQLLAIVDAI
ncbi:redoxin domain-containing protein [Sphingorhabdus sp. Alg231-15]|uniref:redoxin domain-containing protein n=1 Tax=Sphingorhabdus sp. Alg231-15 TaxID=1922222 RepID=UPI000D55658B